MVMIRPRGARATRRKRAAAPDPRSADGSHAGAARGVAAARHRPAGKVSTRVEIVNKRVLATNITAPDWDVRLFKALDARLKPN
jgi:hypothetical protein